MSSASETLANLAAELAAHLITGLAGRLRGALFGDAETAALGRAWEQAFGAMVDTVAAGLELGQIQLLEEVLRLFVAAEGVDDALLDLALEGGEPPLALLRDRFDALEFDRTTLPVGFDAALIALTRGLAEALVDLAVEPDSPLHNHVSLIRVSAIHTLLEQQQGTLEAIAAVVARLEQNSPRDAKYQAIFLGPVSGLAIGDGATVALPDEGLPAHRIDAHVRASKTIFEQRGEGREPLPERLSLESVRRPRGWNGHGWMPSGQWLRPTIGLLDDPANQSQPLLEPDLGRKGHLFICNGAGVDSRSLLRGIVTSLALDHSPDELHFYCLDFGSGSLQAFEGFPHTGAVIAKHESQRIHRLFRWLGEEMSRRMNWLVKEGFGSLVEAHQADAVGGAPPAIGVVVDNLSTVYDDYDRRADLEKLAREGPGAGIHLILTGDPTATRFGRILANVALRMAIQFNNLADYRHHLDTPIIGKDRYVPNVPGRGFFNGPPPLECQVATSISDQLGEESNAELRALGRTMRQIWEEMGGALPAAIGELPLWVPLRPLLDGYVVTTDHGTPRLRVPIGQDDSMLGDTEIDLEADGPHFVVVGPSGGGKTTALTTWVLALAHLFPKEQVQFLLLDSVKASLADLRDLPHAWGYGATEAEQLILFYELWDELARRRQAGQKRARPALVCILDDFGYQESDEVRRLLEKPAQRDHIFGFHIIIAGTAHDIPKYEGFSDRVISGGSGFLVGSNDLFGDSYLVNLNLQSSQAKELLPPGRAYLVRHRNPTLIQLASAGDRKAIIEWVRQIARREQGGGSAVAKE